MTKQKQTTSNIAIVGGGLAGFAAAVAILRAGFEVVHIAPETPADRRTSALMRVSVAFLQDIGLTDLDALGTQLTNIRIIDATNRLLRAPETLFESREFDYPEFGWNFSNKALLAALERMAVEYKSYKRFSVPLTKLEAVSSGYELQLDDGSKLGCNLIVGADGRNSTVRQQAGLDVRQEKFDQSALVCDLELQRPIGGTSVEFHYKDGPFTLVPAGNNKANLVWIGAAEDLKIAQELSAEELTKIFAEKSQRLFGNIKVTSPTAMFPLSILHAERAGKNGVVLIGEAAHAFPPIGAQGLNLSLRDVSELVNCLVSANKDATDWPVAVSNTYDAARKNDLGQTSTMVGALFKSLLSDFLPTQASRASGLWALKLLPSVRKKAFELGMGSR